MTGLLVAGSVPVINLLFAAFMAARAVRASRALALYWLLASYFAFAIVADAVQAPFGSAAGFVPVVVTPEMVTTISWFVLGCNVCFAIGEAISRWLVPAKESRLPVMSGRDRRASDLLWFYLAAWAIGTAFYLPDVIGLAYSDFVSDDRWLLSRQIFMCGMPLAPLAVLTGRYWLAALPLTTTLVIVLATHVRDPLLYSAFPLLLIGLLAPWSERTRVRRRLIPIAAGVAMMIGFGSYVMFLRSGHVNLPEFDLTRGMYLVVDRVDHGVEKTGLDSLEIALKSVAWPLYNRHLMPDYSLPDDPPYYVGEIVTAFHARGLRFHAPVLWYADMYLSMSWLGMVQGVVWGLVLGLWEALARRNSVVWAVLLPFFTWTVYMFTRGVVGGAFSRVSPLVYVQVLLLAGAYVWAEYRSGKAFLTPAIGR